jgi:hypothetical protein
MVRGMARGALALLVKVARPLQRGRAAMRAPGLTRMAAAYLLSVGASSCLAGKSRGRPRALQVAAAGAASVARHLWVINLGVNAACFAWSVVFWRQTEAVALCRALPLTGDTKRTIRVVSRVRGHGVMPWPG